MFRRSQNQLFFKKYEEMKKNAGYFWAEKKKEAFFAAVATFALCQVFYRDMMHRSNKGQERVHDMEHRNKVLEARKKKRQQIKEIEEK